MEVIFENNTVVWWEAWTCFTGRFCWWLLISSRLIVYEGASLCRKTVGRNCLKIFCTFGAEHNFVKFTMSETFHMIEQWHRERLIVFINNFKYRLMIVDETKGSRRIVYCYLATLFTSVIGRDRRFYGPHTQLLGRRVKNTFFFEQIINASTDRQIVNIRKIELIDSML